MKEYQMVITEKESGKEVANETATCLIGAVANSNNGKKVPTFTNFVVSEDSALTVASTMLKTVELITAIGEKYPEIRGIFNMLLDKVDEALKNEDKEIKTYVE